MLMRELTTDEVIMVGGGGSEIDVGPVKKSYLLSSPDELMRSLVADSGGGGGIYAAYFAGFPPTTVPGVPASHGEQARETISEVTIAAGMATGNSSYGYPVGLFLGMAYFGTYSFPSNSVTVTEQMLNDYANRGY